MPNDRELLQQYVREGSEAAFAELVRRYLRLVYSAALRQSAGCSALAEDVTQTVFIILARQAPALSRHETLVGWMHACTRYTTLRSLRDLRRRQAREQKAYAMEINSTPPIPWEQVKPLIDKAVGQLNEADRQAVLLRYFQGLSHREVGEALGQTENAARVRVDRAVEKLRSYFARRGIVATSALLGEVILAHATEVEPAGLASRVVKGVASAEAAAALGWTAFLLRIVFMTTKNKIMIAATVVLLAILLTWSIPQWLASPVEQRLVPIVPVKTAVQMENGTIAVESPKVPVVPAAEAAIATDSHGQTGITQAFTDTPPPLSPALGRGLRYGNGNPRDAYGNMYTIRYGNFLLNSKLTADQQAAFIKALVDRKMQASTLRSSAMGGMSLEQTREFYAEAIKRMNSTSTLDDVVNQQLGIADGLRAINHEADARLRELLGSEQAFQDYLTYTEQNSVRQWVINGYGGALQAAGVDALTPAQQETLVGLVAKNLQTGADGIKSLKNISPVLEQVTQVLTPEQIAVAKANFKGIMFWPNQDP